MDYTAIIDAVDWSTVGAGVVAIGAAIAGVLVATKGVQFILGTLKRA